VIRLKAFYRRGKWAGLVLSAAVLGLYVTSYFHSFRLGESHEFIAARDGQVGRYYQVFQRVGEDPRGITIRLMPLWEISLGWSFLAIAVATAWLWYQARSRVEAGHCSCCGYNLTGNISGICPECGTPAKRVESRSDHGSGPQRESR
jgi:hypothetical protein